MRIKSYFTDSVQDAIEHARVEMGPDAMLMNSKKTEPELRALGAYEVVFGVTSDVASASSTVLPKKAASPSELVTADKKRAINGNGGISKGLAALLSVMPPALVAPAEVAANPAASSSTVFSPTDQQILPALAMEASVEPAQPNLLQNRRAQNSMIQSDPTHSSDLSRELADLREQIEAVKRSMLQARDWTANANEIVSDGESHAGTAISPDLELGACPEHWPISEAEEVRRQLVAAGFSAELAGEIGEAVEESLSLGRGEGTATELREAALYAELSRRFRVAPGLSLPDTAAGSAGKAILFAGPAGSGKTTSLLKLALRQSLAGRVPLQILSLDTLRVGGWEQLAAYARIAGLPFNVIHNPAGLGQALAEHRGKKLILIDTPGLSPAEWRETPELATWIAREMARDSGLEVQLVLPAVLRPGIAQRALEQFRALRPSKLLLTHLDEVDAPGEVLELAMRSGLPLSYLAGGQQIPEDLEEASEERLLKPFAAATALSPRVATAA
jgi:flagellar biosynthesis GTPase FlhF